MKKNREIAKAKELAREWAGYYSHRPHLTPPAAPAVPYLVIHELISWFGAATDAALDAYRAEFAKRMKP